MIGPRAFGETFGKRVGRSPAAVKAALRFVASPAVVRHAVAGQWDAPVPTVERKLFRQENLRLAYGIAVELARLQERKGILGLELAGRLTANDPSRSFAGTKDLPVLTLGACQRSHERAARPQSPSSGPRCY